MTAFGKISTLVMALILGAAIIIGGNLFAGNIFSTYDVTYQDPEVQSGSSTAFSKLNESINVAAANLRDSSSTENNFISLSTGAFSAASQAFPILDAAQMFMWSSAGFLAILGLDVFWFVAILAVIMAAYIAFALLQTFFGRDF